MVLLSNEILNNLQLMLFFITAVFRLFDYSIEEKDKGLPRWPSGPERDCYARGLGFDSQVEQKVLLDFSMKYSVAARS